MANKRGKQMSRYGVVVVVAVAIGVIIAGILLWKPSINKNIDNFQSCKDAGGTILESYPEQCSLDGKSFTNDAQVPKSSNGDEYVGLAEQAALDKAKADSKAARVVERDGEALPVTMDYAPGRLNLYIKDGKVDKVEVEGSES